MTHLVGESFSREIAHVLRVQQILSSDSERRMCTTGVNRMVRLIIQSNSLTGELSVSFLSADIDHFNATAGTAVAGTILFVALPVCYILITA